MRTEKIWMIVIGVSMVSLRSVAFTGSAESGAFSIDTVSPRLEAASASTSQSLSLTFSEPMLASGVTAVERYSISGLGQGTLSVHPSAVTGVNPVAAMWDIGEMLNGELISVSVSGVQDVAGNPIDGAHCSGAATGIGIAPAFTDFTVSPLEAGAGQVVTFHFAASEPLYEAPIATVNDHDATLDASGAPFTYTYEVSSLDSPGPASISIVGADLAGNIGASSVPNAFAVVEKETNLPLRAWPLLVAIPAIGACIIRRRRFTGRSAIILAALVSSQAWSAEPAVSNVTAVQNPGGAHGTQVDIYFDLSAPNGPCTITVWLSKNAGADGFIYPANAITGDVTGVGSGTQRHIVWDLRADYPEESIPQAELRVIADDGIAAQHTLTYSAGAHGSISGTSPQLVSHGADGTEVMAVPDSGYAFTAWSDGVLYNPRQDVNVTADIAVTAEFGQWTWTWMKGMPSSNPSGVYGTLGGEDAANTPGGRMLASIWTDPSGKVWLFGGSGYNDSDDGGGLSDLWRFDPASRNWTWIGGDTTINHPPVYGTLGTPAGTNTPGGRIGTASWIDTAGNLWLFGGSTEDGMRNDLWKYTVSTGQWTWMKGSSTDSQVGVYGTMGVAAETNTPGARMGMAAWTDAAGNFWLFGGAGYGASGGASSLNDQWKYTVSTGQWTWMKGASTTGQSGTYGTRGIPAAANIPGARVSACCWTDADGGVWLFGGVTETINGFRNDLWKFDPDSGYWTWINGPSDANSLGVYGTLGEAAAANQPGARMGAAGWIDGTGSLWLFGGEGIDSAGQYGCMNDVWKFDPRSGAWTWVKGASTIEAAGVYGVLGQPHPQNTPGARMYASAWTDASGVPWLFGGIWIGEEEAGFFNDLWQWNCLGL